LSHCQERARIQKNSSEKINFFENFTLGRKEAYGTGSKLDLRGEKASGTKVADIFGI